MLSRTISTDGHNLTRLLESYRNTNKYQSVHDTSLVASEDHARRDVPNLGQVSPRVSLPSVLFPHVFRQEEDGQLDLSNTPDSQARLVIKRSVRARDAYIGFHPYLPTPPLSVAENDVILPFEPRDLLHAQAPSTDSTESYIDGLNGGGYGGLESQGGSSVMGNKVNMNSNPFSTSEDLWESPIHQRSPEYKSRSSNQQRYSGNLWKSPSKPQLVGDPWTSSVKQGSLEELRKSMIRQLSSENLWESPMEQRSSELVDLDTMLEPEDNPPPDKTTRHVYAMLIPPTAKRSTSVRGRHPRTRSWGTRRKYH
ncbi:hypothetical protein EGW08_001506 [Elysia chlorotica]|uniref:Uncharacterized protein n=1 Tax=Elysia chlorotica TaxID=188477 RepID=A0A433UA86_ELYCH|nr:hypothetical protein EGW08_001506 [Elysia chlorotica]